MKGRKPHGQLANFNPFEKREARSGLRQLYAETAKSTRDLLADDKPAVNDKATIAGCGLVGVIVLYSGFVSTEPLLVIAGGLLLAEAVAALAMIRLTRLATWQRFALRWPLIVFQWTFTLLMTAALVVLVPFVFAFLSYSCVPTN